ncbi:MAG: rod shape-determining protein MreC [Eggerthellaceae bacterium]|nr:rod shape-determining protein MreC [Eggerthellaceae bacterium]
MPLNLQQNGSSGARSIVLVVLLVVSLVLMTVYAREGAGGPIHSIQSALMGGSAAVNSAGSGIGTATESAAESLTNISANDSTLSGLRQQNQELRELLSNAEEYRQEAERLQALLDMKQVSGVTGPVAHIIGRSANAWDQSITIDLGSDDGVESGMTIMGATGVIGQVSQTSPHSSTVRLLTDPNSGAAVMIQSTRDNGIVRGSINGILYLEDLNEDVIPEVGDVIVTSGLGGSYERGLIVGAVVSVNKTASNPGGTIVVSPNDSAALLEEVIVVFNAPDVAAAEAAAAKAEAEAAAARAQEERENEEDEWYDEGNGDEA